MKTKNYIDFSRNLLYTRLKKIVVISIILLSYSYLIITVPIGVSLLFLILFLLGTGSIFLLSARDEVLSIWSKEACFDVAEEYRADRDLIHTETVYFRKLEKIDKDILESLCELEKPLLSLIHRQEYIRQEFRKKETVRLQNHIDLWAALGHQNIIHRIWRLLTWSYPRLVTNGRSDKI